MDMHNRACMHDEASAFWVVAGAFQLNATSREAEGRVQTK